MNDRLAQAVAIALALACVLRLLHTPDVLPEQVASADPTTRDEFIVALGRDPRPPAPAVRAVLEDLARRRGPGRFPAVWALCQQPATTSTVQTLRAVLRDPMATPINRGSAAIALVRAAPSDAGLRARIAELATTADPVLALFLAAARR